MLLFIARRVGSLILILLVLVFVLFAFQDLSALDPARDILGENAPEESVQRLREQLGLNRPFLVQFFGYVAGLLQGSFGVSYRTRQPVGPELLQYLPATLELGFTAILLTAVLGILFALTTLHRSLWLGAYRLLLIAANSAPPFLLGILALLLFYRVLGWFPASGRTSTPSASKGFVLTNALFHGDWALFADSLSHLMLPALCIALGSAVVVGRVFGSNLRTTLDQDFIRTARSKGLPEPQVIRRHVIRNSSATLVSLLALQLAAVFAGALVVEIIFSWPGLGIYMSRAIKTGDLPAVTGVSIILAAGYVVANTIADILQGLIDPRVRGR